MRGGGWLNFVVCINLTDFCIQLIIDYLGVHLSPSTASKLTAYHIMYKGKPLHGWFHLKLEITDKDAISLEQVYADVETSEDRYAVAGSFVRTKFGAGGCGTENAERKYDYGPCQ